MQDAAAAFDLIPVAKNNLIFSRVGIRVAGSKFYFLNLFLKSVT